MLKKLTSKQYLILFIAIILVTLYYINLWVDTYNEQKSQAIEIVNSSVNMVSDSIDVWFNERMIMLETVSSDIKAVNSIETTYDIIQSQNGNKNGVVVYVGLEDDTLISTEENQAAMTSDVYFPTQRGWYIDAVAANGEIVISAPYEDFSSSETIITFSKYIGEIEGKDAVVAFDVPISIMEHLLYSSELLAIDYYFLVDENGNMVLHPNEEYAFSEDGPVSISSIEEYEVLLETSEPVMVTDYTGTERLLVSANIETVDWTLVAVANPDLLYSEFLEMFKQTLPNYILLIALFTAIISIYSKSLAMKKIKAQEEASSGLYHTAISQIDTFILDYDVKQQILHCSRAMSLEFGLEDKTTNFPACLYVKNIIDGEGLTQFMDAFNRCYNGEEKVVIEVILKHDDHHKSWHKVVLNNIFDTNGNLIRIVGTINNIERELDLEQKTLYDQLTGLYNKASAREKIEAILANYEDKNYLMLVTDLDNFKHVNDTYGHAAGDIVLENVAQIFGSIFREDDILSRFGGDEYIIFIKGIDEDLAVEKIESIFEKFRNHPLLAEYEVGISVGAAFSPSNGSTFVELFENADNALYEAKNNGKGSYVIFNDNHKTTNMEVL